MTKIALVTGASAGFGKAIAEQLIAQNIKVIGAARRIEKLRELEGIFGSERFYPLQMDVSEPTAIDKALAALPKEWKAIDILVNNAGLALGLDKAYEADVANWLTMINTNIIGLIYLTRQVLPQMVSSNNGMIINIGSTAGTIPYPGANVYGASKAFVKQFSLNLRADLAGTNIRVTNIEPGLCEEQSFLMFALRVTKSVLKHFMQVHMLFSQGISQILSHGLLISQSMLTLIVWK